MNLPDEFRPPEFDILDQRLAEYARIDHLWKQINGLQAAIEEKEQEIKEYQAEIEHLKAQLKAMG